MASGFLFGYACRDVRSRGSAPGPIPELNAPGEARRHPRPRAGAPAAPDPGGFRRRARAARARDGAGRRGRRGRSALSPGDRAAAGERRGVERAGRRAGPSGRARGGDRRAPPCPRAPAGIRRGAPQPRRRPRSARPLGRRGDPVPRVPRARGREPPRPRGRGAPARRAREGPPMSPATDRWTPLGKMLINDGILTEEQLSSALDRQRRTRERLGQVLIEMKFIDEEVLLKYLGTQFRKEPITRQELSALDLDVVKLVPEEVARQHGVIAAERHGRGLVVATADPLNVGALDDLRRATGLDVDFRIGAAGASPE